MASDFRRLIPKYGKTGFTRSQNSRGRGVNRQLITCPLALNHNVVFTMGFNSLKIPKLRSRLSTTGALSWLQWRWLGNVLP